MTVFEFFVSKEIEGNWLLNQRQYSYAVNVFWAFKWEHHTFIDIFSDLTEEIGIVNVLRDGFPWWEWWDGRHKKVFWVNFTIHRWYFVSWMFFTLFSFSLVFTLLFIFILFCILSYLNAVISIDRASDHESPFWLHLTAFIQDFHLVI